MFPWASTYDYDFAFAAIPIQLILLVYFSLRRNLPVRSTASFIVLMLSNLVMTIADIAGCECTAIWDSIPLWVTYAVNMVYFVAFAVRGWALFDYTANECYAFQRLGRSLRVLAVLPSAVVVLLTLSTPLTSAIFSVSPELGYASGSLYPSIYVSTYIYIGLSLLCVGVCVKRLPLRLATSMVAYNLIMLVGIMVRGYFPHTLVMSYASILAILVIYLSAQNPDLMRNQKSGLFNRAAFERVMLEARSHNLPFHCVVVVIQNYDSAKSLYGYAMLANGVRAVGRWMVENCTDYYVFHWGGGFFVLLARGEGAQGKAMANAVLDRFALPWELEDGSVSLMAGAMVLPYAVMPKSVPQITELVSHALSKASVTYGSGELVISKDTLDELSRRKAVENAVGTALVQHRFEVYLQPIYSTKEGRIVGAEALARLNDPDLGFIPPNEFIGISEKNGDIAELGRQIFDCVCAFAATEQLDEWGVRSINVNLSPAQCLDERLCADLTAIAQKYGVDMSLFDFEVTESSFGDPKSISRQLVQLRKHGAKFSLDDFGTGVSNLTRLMELPIHVVKLDVDVVQSYFTGKSSVLPDLVRMFKNAHMKTVLEGVETREMKEALEEMGCDFGQGYYFSRPLPTADFVAYMNSQSQQS